jgi:hypothetical protein
VFQLMRSARPLSSYHAWMVFATFINNRQHAVIHICCMLCGVDSYATRDMFN